MMKEVMKMDALLIVFICIGLGVIGQITMKAGMNQVGAIELGKLVDISTLLKVFLNPFVFSGVVCYGLSLLLWLVALSKLNVSFIYPLISISYVLTSFFAVVFLKETVTLWRWTGTALIVIGCFLILKN
ncbi:EamA family transporter [Candidatus Micrarchaeota archaeon]|nr:EamA family transporter [Candidatus Micrarchaeota archaeon]